MTASASDVEGSTEGETIIILNGTTPVAKLSAIDQPTPRRPNARTRTAPSVHYVADAFRPLSDAELREEWGAVPRCITATRSTAFWLQPPSASRPLS